MMKSLKEWFEFQKTKIIFFWEWRIAPDEETKQKLKAAYIKHRNSKLRMKKLLEHLENKNYRDEKDTSWYVGTIPDNWEERIDQKIRKLEKE